MLPFPTIVVESGWTESCARLNNDKDLWLIGGRPHVQLVFLIKWAKLSGGRVKGDIEIHGRDQSGNAMLLQTEVRTVFSYLSARNFNGLSLYQSNEYIIITYRMHSLYFLYRLVTPDK